MGIFTLYQYLTQRTLDQIKNKFMYTKQQRIALLQASNAHTWLTGSELFTILLWEWFNKKKAEAFYRGLQKGMHPPFAYRDASKI